MLWLTISGIVLAVSIAAKIFFRRRPPEMSEMGRRHFRTGLTFAVSSSAIFAVLCVVVFAAGDRAPFTPLHPLNFWIVFGGFVCNGISLFSFVREIIQLIPGREVTDITPEGMFLGFLMGLSQMVWLIFLCGLMFAP